jgi:nucleotide-binding universal stress UspA family protein
MAANIPLLIVARMHDDFRPGIEAMDALEPSTPRLFARVLLGGEAAGPARRDAVALAGMLAGGSEVVTVAAAADLIVVGSARDAAPGRATLDLADRALVEGATCPVAVAPRGLAERDEKALRSIAVGVDGGQGAAQALRTAAHLARSHDARLRLLGVAELSFDVGGAARPVDPRELARLSRHLTQAAAELTGIEVETELREGLADQVILGLTREDDLLVLGSRAAYGNAGRVVLGTLIARVLRGAPCPVLIVPAP